MSFDTAGHGLAYHLIERAQSDEAGNPASSQLEKINRPSPPCARMAWAIAGWQCSASAVTVQPCSATIFSACRLASTSLPAVLAQAASDRRVSASQTPT